MDKDTMAGVLRIGYTGRWMIIEDTLTKRQTGGGNGFSFETAQVADDWRDLQRGEVNIQNTSFTAEQTETAEIYKGLQESAWPDVWYELVQGAFEYNDWSKGLPEVIITYEDGESVSLQAFVREWPRTQRIVRKVVIQNHIKGDSGLRPSNTYLTHHQEKNGKTEFGKYGRGMKGAFTAIAAELLAERVTFESFAPGIGSWFGEARMAKDPDPQAPEYYQVAYKTTQQEQIPLTSITVEKPSALMLAALVKLQDWFLPLHPDYQFSPLNLPGHALERQTVNPTTLSRSKFAQRRRGPYSPAENEYLTNYFPENGRAEIVSRELFPNLESGAIDWLFVDGWRVRNQKEKFANIYAFSGMSENIDQERNPHRSNDSVRVEGEYGRLVADVLYFTHDPMVFYRIFKYGFNDPLCAEWANTWLNSSTLANFPAALDAVSRAWERYAAEKKFKQPLYFCGTNEAEAENAKKKYGINVLTLNSNVWVQILLRTGRVSSLSAFLAEEAQKQEARADQALRAGGIEKQATATGETIKLQRKPLDAEQQYNWLSEFAYELAAFEGSVRYDAANQVFGISLNQQAVDGLPKSISQLNELGKLINRFYAFFGGAAVTVVESYQENVAEYLNFTFNTKVDQLGNHSLNTNLGKLIPNEKRGIVVSFRLNTNNEDVSRIEKHKLRNFFEYVFAEIQKISFPDGKINPEAYNASQLAEHHPRAQLMFKLRQQSDAIQAEMVQQLAAMNKILEKAGLPTKKASDFIKPSAEKANNSSEEKPRSAQGMFQGLIASMEAGKGKSRTSEKIKVKDGPRTYEKTIDLGHPDEVWGLSSLGEEEALLQTNQEKNWYERWKQQLRDAMEEALQALVNPDITFNPGSGQFKINRYLVHSVDASYSSVSIKDYQPLTKALVRKRLANTTSITFNKPDANTEVRGLPCPYGYRPIGYYNKSGTEVFFSGMPERGFFGLRSDKGIEAGLTVYFEPIPDFADTTEPDEYEASTKVIEDHLNGYWQDLIAGLRVSSLTDKQKVDVLLRAWKRNQSYKKTQTTFDKYQGLSGVQLATTVVNLSEGNCGYIDLGFIGLVSTLLPTRSVKSLLFNGKGLDINKARHGLSQVYIDGRWVAIEAQGAYVQPGYEIEPVPDHSRLEIEALIDEVRPSLLSGFNSEMGLADGMVATGQESRIVPTMTLAMLFTGLQAVGINVRSLIEKNQNEMTSDEKMTSQEVRKLVLKLSATMALGIAGTQLIDNLATKLVEIAINYRIAVEGLPAAVIFDKIYASFGFLDDPRIIIVSSVLLAFTAWEGGYYAGLSEKTRRQLNLIPTEPATAPAEVREM